MNNIYVLNKNYKKIGTLSNQGANPQAPYYEDLFVQELETGADTYQFSTTSSKYTQDILEIGNHIMFAYKNRNELFTITSLEYSHNEGYKTIGVYAEGIGFDLLEVYMKRPENEKEDEGGRDEDNDGDTSTDDEYADLDDMYLDENGIIVYDKDGSGPPKEEDMYVDENGIIVYRRNKRNRKNDSLEFKNISYSRFLSILLKNTGWSYVCQPGLESVKHDITVRYDTNIFALLQDSMQSYRGVELEFVHELVGGRVQKVIKAYKDGGRGSFVGKRFEYGKNVRGITKTQEVTDSEDDTILYVDNVGINVQYDVDFALKSAEIPEIEIGDTHYVIDNDFCPPMQIKARIGKIEISFSDPTVNKIYLANNKRISGSAIEDKFGADDVADMLDDYEYGDNGAAYDHYHDRLICQNTKTYVSEDGKTKGTTRWQTSVELSNYKLLPDKADWYDLGDKYTHWDFAYTNNIRNIDDVSSPRYFGYNYQVYYERKDMEDVAKITNSSNITKQDLLNFVMNDLNVYEYSSREVNEAVNRHVDDENALFGNQIYLGILSDDIVSPGSNGKYKTSKVGRRIGKGTVEGDTNNDGDQNVDDATTNHTYNIPALLAALIGAFQQHVITGKGATTSGPSPKDYDYDYEGGYGDSEDPYNPDDPGTDDPDEPGYGTITGTFDVARGNLLIADVIDAISIEAVKVEISDRLYVNDIAGTSISHMTAAEIDAIKTGIIDIGVKAKIKEIEFPDGSTMTTANGSGGTPGTGNVFNTITVTKIQGPDPGEGQYNCVEFADAIKVGHIWSNNGSSIQMEDELVLNNGLELYGDLSIEEGNISANEIHPLKIVFPDGSELTTANGLSSGGDTGGDSGGGTGGDSGGDTGGNTGGGGTTGGIINPNAGWWDGTGSPAEGSGSILGKYNLGGPIVASQFSPNIQKDQYETVVAFSKGKMKNPLFSVNGDMVIAGHLGIIGIWSCNGTAYSDRRLKENIRYITNTDTLVVEKENLDTRDYTKEDLITNDDLYDFIVNQLDVCEYDYIIDETHRPKIGFIANDYEGTKVGDKIVFKDEEVSDFLGFDQSNLLFATIGALQEEVRIKDEKIASLEARLAAIEAMLGINND